MHPDRPEPLHSKLNRFSGEHPLILRVTVTCLNFFVNSFLNSSERNLAELPALGHGTFRFRRF
jgi:hypothetical protein